MDDLISRQDVLALPRNKIRNIRGEIVEETINVACIEQLPSARPERKTSKWIYRNVREGPLIYRCDRCNACHRAMYDFCPSCGADMRRKQDACKEIL